MNIHSFSLQPFSSTNLLSFKIAGNIARHFNTLAIRYELLGRLAELVIPKSADIPTRRNELWEETCLEFFLGIKNSPQYWEFNLSLTGDWNVYHFADYRQGMQEEIAFKSLPFSVYQQLDCLSLVLELNLAQIVPAEQALEVAISSVIKLKNGELSYWALTHCGMQADFHRRDGFVIEL